MIQKTEFIRDQNRYFMIFKNYTKILLGDFNAKVGSGNIFKPTPGSGVRIVKFAITKFYFSRARCSPTETVISSPGPLLIGRVTNRQTTHV